MTNYVVYEKDTGKIIHTCQFFRIDSDKPQEASEYEVKAAISRVTEPSRVKFIVSDISPQSSREFSYHVDPKTEEVVVKKVTQGPK